MAVGPFKINIVDFPGATGTFDVTNSGAGTCKGAFLVCTYSDANDGTPTSTQNARCSVGFVDDDGDQAFLAGTNQDATTTTDTYHEWDDDACCEILSDAGGITGTIIFSSFITDGIRFDCTDSIGFGPKIMIIMFYGSDVSTQMFKLFANATENGTATTTTVNQRTDALILLSTVSTSGNEGVINATSQPQVGFAALDSGDTITQCACRMRCRDAEATTRNSVGMTGSFVGMSFAETDAANSSMNRAWEVTDLTASGSNDEVEITSRFAAISAARAMLGLSINFNGQAQAKVGTTAAPTSTGVTENTGPGFQPLFVFLMTSLVATLATSESDAVEAGAGASGIGWGAFSDDQEQSMWWGDKDGVGTSECNNMANPTALHTLTEDAADEFEAVFSAFTSNGFSLNFTTVDAAADFYGWLAIEDPDAGVAEAVVDVIGAGGIIPFAR